VVKTEMLSEPGTHLQDWLVHNRVHKVRVVDLQNKFYGVDGTCERLGSLSLDKIV